MVTGLDGTKIVFVFGNLELGGAERQGLLLAEYLKRTCRADVVVYGLCPQPGTVSETCDRIGIPWKGLPFWWGIRGCFKSFAVAMREMRSERAEILIPYTRVPNLVCAWGWRLTGARVCLWNQEDEGLDMMSDPLHWLGVRLPHLIISNSTGGKDFLVRSYGIAPAAVRVIHNGIAPLVAEKSRGAWRRELGVASDTLVACMVANLTVYKDQATLVKAWRSVVERGEFSTPPVLVLAGRLDGEEKKLHTLAEELGIAELVRIPGKVGDVAGLLQAVDLFAFSSRSEGVPNAVLEAMAAGLPVVGSDIPGIREAVGPQGSSYLTPVGDSESLADRILMFLKEKELTQKVGRSLKGRVEREFTLERMCRSTCELLLELRQGR